MLEKIKFLKLHVSVLNLLEEYLISSPPFHWFLKIDKKKSDSAISLSFGSNDVFCAAEMEKEKEAKTLRVQNVWQRCPRGYTPQL